MKKTTMILLTIVLACGVVGCSGEKTGVKSNGKSIMIYAQKNGLGDDWLLNAAKAYESKTGTKVNVEFDAFLSTNITSTLETSSVEVGDLYYVQTGEWSRWAMKDNLVADLTEFMNEEGEDGKSLNERAKLATHFVYKEDGSKKQVIVPLEASSRCLVYNKKMMNYICQEVLGWDDEHAYPVNTKELKEVIAVLETIQTNGEKKELFTYTQDGQTQDVEAFVWSGSTGMLEFFTLSWIYQYLGETGMTDFYNQWDNCDMLKHDAFYIAYQEMVDLLALEKDAKGTYYSTTSIPNCISYNHTAAQSQFLMNKALMCPTGSWFYSEMESTITDVDNLGYMPIPWLSDDAGNPLTDEGVEMPKDDKGNYLSIQGAAGPDFFVIPARSEKQEDAKDFLHFMFSTEYMPNLLNDIQTPLAFEFDDSSCEKTAWYHELEQAAAKMYVMDVWTGSKLQSYSLIGFYSNPMIAPHAQLSLCQFGSNDKLVDSATGKKIKDASEATGIAVTENVYNYVTNNWKKARDGWQDNLRIVGGKN